MKKQFLLGLMAMLLPLGAWADNFVVKTTWWLYSGIDIEPQVYTQDGNTLLTYGTDYTVSYTYGTDEESVNAVHNAGSYKMTITAKPGGSCAEYSETIVSLTVQKAELLVQPSEMYKTYGTPDSEVEIKYYATGYKGNDYRGNVDIDGITLVRKEEGETVGSYNVALGISTATATNYDIKSNTTAQLIIQPAVLTVKFDALSWTYGETEEKLDLVSVTATGYAVGEEFEGADDVELSWDFAPDANVTKETIRNAGTYPIVASINSKNYTLKPETKASEIIINKKELTVSFEKALSKTYGLKDPDFTELAEVEGLVTEYGDTKESIGLTLTRSNGGENAGNDYTVDAANELQNYTVATFSEEFTIYKKNLADADITITVAENDKVYQGQAADFALNTITVTYGNKEIDQDKDLTQEDDYTFTITQGLKNAGSEVTVTVTAAADGNYMNENATCTFEIEKALLDITINDQEFQYDATKTAAEMLQPDEYNVGDLQPGDSRDGLGIELYPYGDAAKGSVGKYIEGIRFEAKGEIANNYKFNPTYGTLTITGDPNGITLDGSLETDEVSNTVAAYNGKEVDVTIKKLTSFVDMENSKFEPNVIIKAEKWYTLALPFDVTVRELSALFGYAIVNVPNTDNADGEVRFKLTMQTVPANTLMAFKVDKDIIWNTEKEVTFEGKTIVAPTDDYSQEKGNLDGAGNKFIATYKKQHITEATQRYIFPKDGKFYPADAMSGGVDIYPLNGYVECVSTSARIYMEEPDGSTTAVSAITGEAINNAEGWYTIGGVKLNDIPTEKGIYINNGKKVVIK